MTHRSRKTRFLAPVLASVLAPAMALGTVLAVPIAARAAVTKADCQAYAVALTKDGDGVIPPDLEFLKSQLQNEEFAAYKGFHLLERKSIKLALDTKTESTFASGHKLGLTLLGGDDTRLKLQLDLSNRDATKSLLSTSYSIENNGVLMVGAGAFSDATRTGKLFFAIQCARAG